ncbi:unnamed protein product [Phaedon cochleariae]|uniref:Cytochrome P450 n=1 Tax=Phaedon cochleariae TaxID=80249 RepID=A0A9N9SMD2_PHACE|nr:unnamed protein product [Phaedon cochleariae]
MAAIVIFVASALVVYMLYRWYQERLDMERKLKWVPKVPGVPILGNVLDFGKSTEFLNTLTKYSNQYRGLCQMSLVQDTFLVASDHSFLEFLLTSTKVLNKSASYKFLAQWLGKGLILADGAKSKVSRKFLTPSFHFKILEEFVEVFESNGNTLVEILEQQTEETTVDIYPFITMCTLDIICESTMGVSLNAQRHNQSEYVFAVKELCRIEVDRTFSPFKMYDLLYPLSRDYYKEKKYVKILHDQTDFVIRTRKAELEKNGGEKTDEEAEETGMKKKMAFLDLMLQARVDGQALSDQEIREEVDTGHDTTSSAIGFTLYCLATNPHIQSEALVEQKLIFGNDRNRAVTHRDLQTMKFLEMVIKEALRLYPSVPFVGRLTDKEVEYKDGKVIPKNVGIIVFIFGVNRNPEVFPDPEKFDPFRFDNETRTYSPYAYIPFSAGPRNCIGQKFAMLEMKSLVSKILRNFVLLPSGDPPILAAETVLKSANGIQMKLRKRDWI